MDSPSIEVEIEAAKKRLLRLAASVVALVATAISLVFVANNMAPKNLEAEKSEKVMKVLNCLVDQGTGLQWGDESSNLWIRVSRSGELEAVKFSLEQNEATFRTYGGKAEPIGLGSDGLVRLELKHKKTESCSDSQSLKEAGPISLEDCKLVVVEQQKDSVTCHYSGWDDSGKRTLATAARQTESKLRVKFDTLNQKWENERRNAAALAVKQAEDAAIEKLLAEYPVGKPICFVLATRWSDTLRTKLPGKAGMNSTTSAISSMEHLADDVVWLTRLNDSEFKVQYRNRDMAYPPVTMKSMASIDSKSGIKLACKTTDEGFGWKTLDLNLADKSWSGAYNFAIGRPSFEFKKEGPCLFAVNMDGSRPGRWLVKAIEPSRFKFEAKRLGSPLIGIDVPEVSYAEAKLYPEMTGAVEKVLENNVDGPLGSELRMEGYWIDEPNLKQRTFERVSSYRDYYEAYGLRLKHQAGSFPYVETVHQSVGGAAGLVERFVAGANTGLRAAEYAGVERGWLLKSVDSKDVNTLSSGEFEDAMFSWRSVDLEFVKPERYGCLRSLLVPSNHIEELKGSMSPGDYSLPSDRVPKRAIQVNDSENTVNSQSNTPPRASTTGVASNVAIAEQVVTEYYARANSSHPNSARQLDLFDATANARIYHYGEMLSKQSVKESSDAHDAKCPYRHFDLSSPLKTRDRGDSSVDVVAKFSHKQGLSEAVAERKDSISFIRVRVQNGVGSITHIDKSELPGWLLANYNTDFSYRDLHQQFGRALASLSFDSRPELWREILLMDRWNYNQNRRDPGDGYEEMFDVKKTDDMRRKIEGLPIRLEGSEATLLSGKARAQVYVLNKEVVVIRILNR